MGVTCLVTIHGIGFQEPPRPGVAGYADDLQANLARLLPDLLGDDPGRRDYQAGESVPIYVCSRWPPKQGARNDGLSRLGTWSGPGHPDEIDTANAPLVQPGKKVAHVALVYSHLEDLGPQPLATVEATTRALVEHHHYESVGGIVRGLLSDGLAALEHQGSTASPDAPARSLQRRTDVEPEHRHRFHIGGRSGSGNAQPGGLLGTLRQLEDDVAAYVCRNDMRERVRSFIAEAMWRLAARADVSAIVLNTHSNGTVMGFDFLRAAPPDVAGQVRLFVTAGSPLRKYVDLFSWGAGVDHLALAGAWRNFLDLKDPVADPLAQPPGSDSPPQSVSEARASDLFTYQADDAALPSPFALQDIVVDNLTKSRAGGLRAHNYWDNLDQFITPLAASLGELTD